jgi:N-acyl-D-amino-acid deacylase
MRVALSVLLSVCTAAGSVEAAAPGPEAIKRALDKAIPLIKTSIEEYPRHRDCFSCHHQAVPALALSLAKDRGFAIGDDTLQAIGEHTRADLESALDDYKKGKGQPGSVERAGYALFTLETAKQPRDEVTDAVTDYLIVADKGGDHWRTRSNRPPSEASDFTASYLAVRGLKTFGTTAQKDQIAKRIEDTRRWLKTAKPRDTEDRVFRLFALKAADMPAEEIKKSCLEIIKTQNENGGWAQIDGKESDAYATGSVLVALHQAGDVSVDDPAYRRGLAFLIETQRDDGSWRVTSRSKPFQTYFESGFPHGKDQFISVAGSSWASAALLLALPQP